MDEFELKFQVSPAQRRAVKAFVMGRAARRGRLTRLQAAYFDTPDRLLACHGMALRVRREGDRWVQTLKGGGGDGLARSEHEVPLEAAPGVDADAPAVDPLLHAGSLVGDRLIELLARHPGDELQCRYRTDVERTTRELATRLGKVELAFDQGFIESPGRWLQLCELEIELIGGHPLAVLDVARRWAPRFGLWLDTRSKAERGDMLARGVEVATVRGAGKIRLDGADSAAGLLQAMVADCRAQILGNASQIASGLYQTEHLHQLRVGLRRLRTAFQLFDGDADTTAIVDRLTEPAAQLFRGLGPERDRSVLAGPMTENLMAEWREAGQSDAWPAWLSEPMHSTPTALLRERSCQALFLDLIEVGLPAFNPPSVPSHRSSAVWPTSAPAEQQRRSDACRPADMLARRLSKWHRAVLRDAADFEHLDDASRHRLRKRLKRLVYGAEFAASLFERKRLRRLQRSLKPLQRCLGDLNDVVGALVKIAGRDDLHWFAIGWLHARRKALLAEARPLLQGLDRSTALWKHRSKAGRASAGR